MHSPCSSTRCEQCSSATPPQQQEPLPTPIPSGRLLLGRLTIDALGLREAGQCCSQVEGKSHSRKLELMRRSSDTWCVCRGGSVFRCIGLQPHAIKRGS